MTDQKLRKILQEHGLKATYQRMAVLEYLATNKTHPTAEMIHGDLNNISLATVYNTLDKLIETGLIIAIDIHDDGKRHFDYYGEPHYHIINQQTSEIIDADNFDMAPLFDAARKASGLNITGYHIEVFGVNPEDS
ncbi:Fur family transcriptional regulator [Leuconostoc suionicum]|uniref:Fur family transcriptional regulator n=1 Tax=Leuconostoc suionicum TaxID=1511761 RepID=UPI001B8CA3C5|nr:Fur family transcriptional regulator [Leuconostoc suionicum]MBS1007555.1 transcriptional repressor [Leuconostoc suionicum]